MNPAATLTGRRFVAALVTGVVVAGSVVAASPMRATPRAAPMQPAPAAQLAKAGDATGGDDSEGEALFRDTVFPVLREECFRCHGPQAKKLRGGLMLNGAADLLHGGDSGPAVVPGDADGSLLVQAVRRTDPDLEMPPDDALPPDAVAAIARWVTLGAPWPDDLVDANPGAHAADAATARAEEAAATAAAARAAAELPPPTHDELMFFEEKVRPLLLQRCAECHGPELSHVKSGLRLSGRAALLRGGDRGPALVPGAPDASLLVKAVRWVDPVLSMPPDSKLSAADIAVLESWVALGAPWPADGTPAADMPEAEAGGVDFEAGRQWWSFRPVVRPEPPAPRDAADVANPIDAFVLAKLEAQGLASNPLADRATLVRRAYFDLLGLPPSLEQVQAFVRDDAPDAWPRLVDALLARPEYGERWGRHWLDVVRWAQTNGYERDTEKPFAWRYRDWVIDAFNADMPYDEFVLQQLAGDELPDAPESALVATGVYRLGVWDDEPDDAEQAGFDELDDQVRIIGEGFLGVTLGCARCHDHKFDPFAQEDYYATVAFLRNVRHYTAPRFTGDSSTLRPLGFGREAQAKWERDRAKHIVGMEKTIEEQTQVSRRRVMEHRRDALPEKVRAALDTPAAQRTPADQALIAEQKDYFRKPTAAELKAASTRDERRETGKLQLEVEKARSSYQGDLTWALSVREARGPAPDTHVLVRGLASSPAQLVQPRFVQVLCPTDEASVPVLPPPDPRSASTGRRLALARWIVSGEHPTTARVLVNRLWLHHFGRGLVETPDDFGRTGALPSHPELLDWLASEFVRDGWSIKAMHRLIMNSHTYRQSSRDDNEAARAGDPDNALLWRQSLRRVEAEAVRDSVLAAAGTLSPERGGRGFFPRLSREALAGGSRPGQGWELPPPTPMEPRSIYGFVKRSLLPPLLEVFDYGNTSLPVGARSVTTLASQALILLNSEFMGEQSAAFAERVRRDAGEDMDAQITRAFELALARAPDDAERAIVRDLYRDEVADFAAATRELVFRSRVPSRLDGGFLPLLSGADLLFGPRVGWSYRKGRWATPYNGTLGVDLAAGPAALLDAPSFRDGSVTARVMWRGGCDLAAFLLRAAAADAADDADADADGYSGLEVVLDPLAGKLRVVSHADGAETVLGEVEAELTPDTWRALRIELAGPRLSVWLAPSGEDAAPAGAAPQLAVDVPGDGPAGVFGVRAWGEALRLADLHLTTGGATHAVPPDDPGTPELRALQSLCLLLFNLDEFLYVD